MVGVTLGGLCVAAGGSVIDISRGLGMCIAFGRVGSIGISLSDILLNSAGLGACCGCGCVTMLLLSVG